MKYTFTKRNNLTKREAAALKRIYGDGDFRMKTMKPCVKEYNQRKKQRTLQG
jgi:hypothetical protein